MGLLLLVFGLFEFSPPVAAQTTSDVKLTRHNLSSSGTGSAKATSETQVCVFCHTPHNATITGTAPLWNRAANAQTYTGYTSSSLDARNVADAISAQPNGSSALCLSCHDGMVALGNVNVLPKNTGTAPGGPIAGLAGTMPTGMGVNTGYTRNLGTNLTNDHPISFTYNDAVAGLDGELAHMNGSQQNTNTTTPPSDVGALIGIRSSGYKPLLPLERTGADLGGGVKAGQMQCGTCHDPHLYDATDPNRKFLRLNRLSKESPADDTFRPALDNICMACHKKSYSSWGMSAHAKESVADETYTAEAAALRGFKSGTKVFEASCLNCHDTHTVQGSRRLLREGVAGTSVGGTGTTAVYQLGSDPLLLPADNNTKSGIETTCFQCHRARDSMNILNLGTGMVPAVKSLFDLPYGMPVATDTQANGTREIHDVTNGNMREDPANLGYGNNANRHAECSDCHNPHRVRRSRTFYSTVDAQTERTHVPGGVDGNMASGVLRGTWGVEPVFGFSETSWPTFPTFPPTAIKEGDPGVVGAPVGSVGTRAAGHVTREYQLCFKCHSNYTNGETKASFAPLVADYAPFTTSRRTPTSAANGLTRYTNVAAEFGSVIAADPPSSTTDQGEFGAGSYTPRTADARTGSSTFGTGAGGSKLNTNNHRSWHPVVFPTGRDRAARRMNTTGRINLLPPFKAGIGMQTMHCSDCHGQARSWIPGQDDGTVAGGADANEVQGPHGSENPFLLRGIWTEAVNLSNIRSSSSQFTTNRPLCGNCHQPRVSGGGDTSNGSGYNNNHVASGSSGMTSIRCMGCHIAVPHGWRNKAFLVNLRCVGTEVGRTSTAGGWTGTEITAPTDCDDWGNYSTKLDEQPYYYRAVLRVSTWQRSGNWTHSSCGGGSMSDASCN